MNASRSCRRYESREARLALLESPTRRRVSNTRLFTEHLEPEPPLPSPTSQPRPVLRPLDLNGPRPQRLFPPSIQATFPQIDLSNPPVNRRSLAQKARRQREALARAQPSMTSGKHHPGVPTPWSPSTVSLTRSAAQRRRRQREAAEAQAHHQSTPAAPISEDQHRAPTPAHMLTPPPTQATTPSARSIAQRLRRQRERQAQPEFRTPVRQNRQLATPEPTQSGQRERSPPSTPPRTSPRAESPPPGGRAPDENRIVGFNPNYALFQHASGQLGAARRPYIEPIPRYDPGPMNLRCSYCGALHWMTEKTANSSIASPEFGMCCNHGKVRIPLLEEPPQPLARLLTSPDDEACTFREKISQYNIALAFTSVGVSVDESINRNGRGPPVFKIHGELKHWAGTLLPKDGQSPAYAQLYVLDPQTALQYRMHRNGNLNQMTMESLQTMLQTENPYAAIYQHAFEILQEHPDAEEYSVRLRVLEGQDRGMNRRRYNLPTADEVAVIVPGDGTQVVDNRDIILRLRPNEVEGVPRGALQRVSDGHSAYSPLHYVLLFPRGEPGWHWNLRVHDPGTAQPRRLSQTRYAAFRLQVRSGEFSTILRSGRLSHRYIVDMWASADQSRLNYLRTHQGQLRASLYNGLEDALSREDATSSLHDLGQRFILPSSYIGGPRHMHQRFQDAMAIARYFKKVDIFMTVTANPKSPEILRELLPGQTASDRPDLVARTFQLTKEEILRDIYKNGVFGKAVAYVYTIEFQKRGLPHMHILIFLRRDHKLSTPSDIDSAIWARWPDPVTQPILFDVVKTCMVHGPCGALDPNAPCMENGKCTKRYPQAFQSHTTMNDDGYPLYFRPDNGRSYEVRGHQLDNSWIVPYNPYFSARYGCHINVECAVSFKTVKYTVKYVHKGGDRGTLALGRENTDEIKQYIEGRYFSTSEALWRIFHFDVHEQIPNVVRLPVHVEDQHMVTFDPNEDTANIRAHISAQEQTALTAFFKANADEALAEEACKYTYQEFPQHFVLQSGRGYKRWKLRERGWALGRMYYIPPTAGERFYLRTLLTVVKGPTSFANLRTYNGILHSTYRDACLARGLLEDDGEWRGCLLEACQMQTGHSLRQLFSTLLLFCNPQKPDELWAEFREHICDDLQHRLRVLGRRDPSPEDAYDYGLFLLDKILQESGRGLEDFPPMPGPQQDWTVQTANSFLAEQLDYDHDAERDHAADNIAKMNPEQRSAYEKIIASVERDEGKLFFLNGPGGTGKTFVYQSLCHGIRCRAWIVLCVASTGIAALLLIGGRTAHSMFKIPIEGLTGESLCNIPKESPRAELLRHTRLIIWDESPMQNRYAFEALDRTCRDIRDTDHPFGGITVVFGGDFQQILPVVVKGSQEDIVSACIQRSYLWQEIEVLKLWRNMRLEQGSDEESFAQWLLDIGHGRNLAADNSIRLRDNMAVDNFDDLIHEIYPGLAPNLPSVPPPEYFLERAILAPRNSDVDLTNQEVLDHLPGDEKTYLSADSIVVEEGADGHGDPIPPEFLRSLDASGLPPGELRVKIGCPLILLRSLAPARGLCNGTRMILLHATERVLKVKIIGGDHHGNITFIPRITLIPSAKNADFAFTLKRRQFPVRLAFAMTINKSQGQSLRYVGVDLRAPVFTHGQLYVAFSRATSGNRVKVLLPPGSAEPRTTNVVFPEVLLR